MKDYNSYLYLGRCNYEDTPHYAIANENKYLQRVAEPPAKYKKNE
jgi:hypothetical protein